MSYEQRTGETKEHGSHSHEQHDLHIEHTHEGHVCSTICEYHQAVQHIDFMESVERHDHSHENGEKHTHGPGCGHTEYEDAHFYVDNGKEKSHFHDAHEEHAHGPNCGHSEYQHVHTEIDKAHTCDKYCEHLDHQTAAEHVDRGKEHAHDTKADHHGAEHIHGPNCGHTGYEEAHKYVDRYLDEQPTAEKAVDHIAGDTALSNGSQSKVVSGSAEEVAAVSPQKAEIETNHALKSETVPSQEISGKPDVSAESQASAATESDDFDTSPIKNTVVVQRPEQEVVRTDNMQVEDEARNKVEQPATQGATEQEQSIDIPEADVIEFVEDSEEVGKNIELDDTVQTIMPLTFADDAAAPEFASEPSFIDKPFEASDEAVADFLPAEMSDSPDLIYETDTLPADFAERELLDTDANPENFEETPNLQFANSSTMEDILIVPTDEESTQKLGVVADTTVVEGQPSLSDFGSGDLSEIFNVELPNLAEADPEELDRRQETARTYITGFIEHTSEITPADLEAMSDQLSAMLQNIPQDRIDELLPLLEELTEQYELPGLEKLVEQYSSGRSQDQNQFARLFISAAQDTQDITVRIGQTVLKLLKIPTQVKNMPYERV